MLVVRFLLTFCLLLPLAPAATAWNSVGHMTVAAIAYQTLNDAQRQALFDILKNTPGFHGTSPGQSAPGFPDWDAEYRMVAASHPDLGVDETEFVFLKAATWPDEVRNSGSPYDHPGWHYVNTPYVPAHDVPTPAVPTPSILTQIPACLSDLRPGLPARTPEQKAAALCWLIHLTGDITQPLHCTTLFRADLSRLYTDGTAEGDRGGNRLGILDASGRTVHLHALWDDLLGQAKFGARTPQEQAQNDYEALQAVLQATRQIAQDPQCRREALGLQPGQTPADWARESYALALSDGYRFRGQALPTALVRDKSSVDPFPHQSVPSLPAGYEANARSIARRQVAKAGYRLADELMPLTDEPMPLVVAARPGLNLLRLVEENVMLADAENSPDPAQTDPVIEVLDLTKTAKTAAYQLKSEHPGVVFTSGRRTVTEQAHAMASNIVSSGDRKWIAKTYISAAKLQQWVDDHPAATTVADIAAGLETTMNAMTDDERAKVSKHLTGQAFDVQPVAANADQIKGDIQALPGLTKFLEKEGGLTRWHAQF